MNKNKRTKTSEHMQAIRGYIAQNGEATTADIAVEIGLSVARTRAILSEMDDVIAVGATNKRVYHLRDQRK